MSKRFETNQGRVISLLDGLYSQITSREKREKILLNRTGAGFTLLQSAVTNGNPQLITSVMEWYEQPTVTTQINLNEFFQPNKKGFNVLYEMGDSSRVDKDSATRVLIWLYRCESLGSLLNPIYISYSPGNAQINLRVATLFNLWRLYLELKTYPEEADQWLRFDYKYNIFNDGAAFDKWKTIHEGRRPQNFAQLRGMIGLDSHGGAAAAQSSAQ